MIQSLYISYDHNEYPNIVTDSYDNLLNYSFATTNVYTIKLNNFNMVLSYLDYSIESKINKAATFLYRTYASDYEYSTLYGNCLIFDSQNNSISPELIRTIFTIYNNI